MNILIPNTLAEAHPHCVGDTTQVDVDGVVRELAALVREATIDLSLRAGKLVVDRFFGGSVAHWRQAEHPSFRALSRHPQLPMSASALRRCVGLFELTQRLGSLAQFERLGPCHFRAVLGLGSDNQRELLALANRDGWTVAHLELRAAELRSKVQSRGGRPRLPPLIKLMRRLGPLTDETSQQLGGSKEVRRLSEVEVCEARALAARMTRLLSTLERHLGQDSSMNERFERE